MIDHGFAAVNTVNRATISASRCCGITVNYSKAAEYRSLSFTVIKQKRPIGILAIDNGSMRGFGSLYNQLLALEIDAAVFGTGVSTRSYQN